ncbi:hypothetical protein DENSPDRAFT_238648 [Dentipellis sp. KUC8613]|nr:hypothetical protein DENSPDRAFT_238648 [Dentipellis sp. KUC8613]
MRNVATDLDALEQHRHCYGADVLPWTKSLTTHAHVGHHRFHLMYCQGFAMKHSRRVRPRRRAHSNAAHLHSSRCTAHPTRTQLEKSLVLIPQRQDFRRRFLSAHTRIASVFQALTGMRLREITQPVSIASQTTLGIQRAGERGIGHKTT